MLKYMVYLEKPTLDHYRQGYNPKEDHHLVFLVPYCMVSGASGKFYESVRGLQPWPHGMNALCGMYAMEKGLEKSSPDLYPELPLGHMEPYGYSETDDSVHYVSENMRLDIHADNTYDWYDAKGRWELHAKLLGRAHNFWVPDQEGNPVGTILRGHISKATGTINGDPVEGLFILDFITSHPGLAFQETSMMYPLHNLCLGWLVEYTDGDYEAGFAWRGNPGTAFAPAHHIRNGVSTVWADSSILSTYNEQGIVVKNRVEYGSDWVELEQDMMADWPMHPCGEVISSSLGKKIAKSWNFNEWVGENYGDWLKLNLALISMAGRTATDDPHLHRKLRIENQRLVIPDPEGLFKSG